MNKWIIAIIIVLLMGTNVHAFPFPSGNSLDIPGKPIKVKVYGDGSMGVWRWDRDNSQYIGQVYNNNSAGSYLFLDKTGYCSGCGSFCGPGTRFTPVSNDKIGSPTVVTVYNAGSTGIQITQITTYTEGYDYYTMVWGIMNNSQTTYNNVRFLHGADTFWDGSDFGYGHWNSNKKMVFITYNGVNKLMGLSGSEASSYYEDVWSNVRDAASCAFLPNTVNGEYHDAAYSLGWYKESLQPGENWAIVATEKLSYALDHIQVSPATATVLLGGTLSLTAVGYDCDNNVVVIKPSWIAENGLFTPTIGTQTIFKGNIPGTILVGCTYSGVTGTASIEVGFGDLVSIEIKPQDKAIPMGSSTIFKAIGYNAKNFPMSFPVSWEITTGIGDILSSSGTSTMFAALEIGEGTLTASFADKKACVRIQVVTPPPDIMAVYPINGNHGSITIGTITGTNFQSGAIVTLRHTGYADVVLTNVNVVDSNVISATFDLTNVASGAWNIVVTNPDGQSGTLTNGFMVIDPLGQNPVLTSITPNTGTNNAVINTIVTGYNLYQAATVTLTKAGEADIVGNITGIGTNTLQINFNLIGANPGEWDVVVTNSNGKTDTMTNGFTVTDSSLDLPEISEIITDKGTTNTTIRTTITGSNFHPDAMVSLTMSGMGAVIGSVTVINKNTMYVDFNLTGVEIGQWDVSVKNPDGTRGTLSKGFSVVKSVSPAISGIISGIGMNNASATAIITGTNFGTGAVISLVKNGQSIFGTTAVFSEGIASFGIDLKGVGTGTWDVVITNSDGISGTLSDGFRVIDSFGDYQGLPMIMEMSTDTATIEDGTASMVITGLNLGSGTVVSLRRDGFADIVATTTMIGSNTLVADFNLSEAEAGEWDVVVTTCDGISNVIKGGFTVLESLPEVEGISISGLSVDHGENRGMITTTITGTNLGTGAVVAMVKPGEQDIVGITTVVGSNTLLSTLDLKNARPGKWDIKVTNQDGKAILLSQGFEITGAGIDLKDIHVYPNPYKPQQGHTKIYFKHLTINCRIRIFTVTGAMVYDMDVNDPEGKAEWDVRNVSGEGVESDVYIYLITNDKNQRASGKISVLR
ncbi:MAG: hypothetical protein QME49_02575 [bacterium]|nr:hypothetical protein [bacterium]